MSLSSPSSPLIAIVLAILPIFPACSPAEKIAPAPTDPVSKKIEAFTGGHTKLAWARYNGSGSDVFGNFDKLQLWGIDTRDGLGVRPILEETSNYARPLILPDGSGIVFSNKQTSRKPSGKRAFKPAVYRVDWDGQNLTKLGPGYAVEVWNDPESGADWVYCTDLLSTDRSSIEGSKLERFSLADPSKRELVWDKTRVSTENIQLSRSGDRASCLFPWPHAGVLNLETMTHSKYQHGCWPSLSPDDSHHAWVFDGAHKNLVLFTDNAAEQWVVPVNTAPGIGGHEMYHPRWSNHARHFAITGPYTGSTVTRSDSGEVEIFVGKFSPDLREVEAWLQITDDKAGDFFPDLWIAGGEAASLEAAPAPAPAPAAEKAEGETWPVGADPHLFVWKNRDATNAVDAAGSRESSVEAKERARFGPRYEMLTDGGFFEIDDASAKAIAELAGNPYTVELLARPLADQQTGIVLALPQGRLLQVKDEWVYSQESADGGALLGLGKIDPKKSSHLAVVFDGERSTAFRDGKPADSGDGKGPQLSSPLPEALRFEPLAGPAFGKNWDGTIEGVAISASASSPEAIAASHGWWDKTLSAREPIPTVKLRGKLLEMTESRPVEALDTYQRGLLGYLYEVEEVLEGEYTDEKVMVMHWTILDRTPLSGFPREIGKSYELVLQPYAAHPELSSERQWNDLFHPAEPQFDVASPGE